MVVKATRTRPAEADLPERVNPALVLAHARAWLGTPYVPQGAVRGAGADCVGLLRGLHAELCGASVPAPPWTPGAAVSEGEPIARELAARMVPLGADFWHPGDVLVMRIGRARAAHVAVYAGGGRFIHADDPRGVSDVSGLNTGRPVTSDWGFPCAPGCETGPAHLTAADCDVTVYSHPSGAFAEITYGSHGAPLARTAVLPSVPAVLALLRPVYPRLQSLR